MKRKIKVKAWAVVSRKSGDIYVGHRRPALFTTKEFANYFIANNFFTGYEIVRVTISEDK